MSPSLSTTPPKNAPPRWLRMHHRAGCGALDMMIFTSLCALDLAELHREKIAEGTYHAWLESEWPMSEEAARLRVRLGEFLERKFEKMPGADAEVAWFRALADRDGAELSDAERGRASRLLRDAAPLANTVRHLFIECGVLAKPPEKPDPAPALQKTAKPRASRPAPAPHVRLGKSWSRLPEEERLTFLTEHLEEIRDLLARLFPQPNAQ